MDQWKESAANDGECDGTIISFSLPLPSYCSLPWTESTPFYLFSTSPLSHINHAAPSPSPRTHTHTGAQNRNVVKTVEAVESVKQQNLIEKDGKRNALAAVVSAKREVRRRLFLFLCCVTLFHFTHRRHLPMSPNACHIPSFYFPSSPLFVCQLTLYFPLFPFLSLLSSLHVPRAAPSPLVLFLHTQILPLPLPSFPTPLLSIFLLPPSC
jgi:hypothetical protein